ncbi:RICIN domain-containing protein [Kitasatospora sp. NPDC096077]|uniref:RICIN domain-containing protein n=1 Tax=Kitasatospora sp. NPDC096077 TaxID=3155544 RepID=UPI003326C282
MGAVAPAAQAAEAPPYLHPCLDTSMRLPDFVYRGVGLTMRVTDAQKDLVELGWPYEGADPDTVFSEGFTSWGTAVDKPDFSVPHHVTGTPHTAEELPKPVYVSTSAQEAPALRFATEYSGFSRVGNDDGPAAGGTKTGWVYKIRPDKRFFSIPIQYTTPPQSSIGEFEWAAIGRIPGSFVVSATKYSQEFVRTDKGLEKKGRPTQLETVENPHAVAPQRDSVPDLLSYGWSPQAPVGLMAPTPADRDACRKVPAPEKPSCPPPTTSPPTTSATPATQAALRSVAPVGVTGAAPPAVSMDAAADGGTAPGIAAPGTTADPSSGGGSGSGRPRPLDGATFQLTAAAAADSPTYNLDARDGTTFNGTTVQAYTRNCSASQNWRLREVSPGQYVVESALAKDVVLHQDLYLHKTFLLPVQNDDAGKPNGSANQRWTFKDTGDGTFSLASTADQQCLTMAGQQSVGLSVKPCDGGSAQKWTLAAPCAPADPVTPVPGRTVPGYQGLPWPTVKGHPELTWPALPGAPGIPWPSVPGYPDVPMPGRPDLPVVSWPGAPQLPPLGWPVMPGDGDWPAVHGFPNLPWPVMPGTKDVPWPILPSSSGPGAGTDVILPGRPRPTTPAVAGHPELKWPAVPGYPDVKWPAVPGSPDVPWPGHPDMPAISWPGAPNLPANAWPSLPGVPSWTWPSIPGFQGVPWPALPGLPSTPWPSVSGFPNLPSKRLPPEPAPRPCDKPGDPGTGTPDPGTGTPDPGTGTPDPGTGTPDPGTGTKPGDPGTGTPDPGTGTTPGGGPLPSLPGVQLPGFPVFPLLPVWGSPGGPGSGPGGGPGSGQRPDPAQGVGITSAADPQLVPDVRAAATAAGTPVQAYQPNGTDAQRWAFWDRGNGNWLIETRLTYGAGRPEARMVLGHDTGSHRTALQAVTADRASQLWKFTDAGNGSATITNGDGGGCLTLSAAGQPLTVGTCDGSDRQKFRLTGPNGGTGGDNGGGNNGGGTPGPQPPLGAGGTQPAHNRTVVLQSGNNGMVADLDGANTGAGTRIKAQGRNGNDAQKWTLWQKPNSQWLIETKLGGGMVMDHNPNTHRTHLQGAQDGNANQLWRFADAGSGWFTMVSAAGNGCLTATAGGEDLAIRGCDDTNAQKWRLTEAVDNPPTDGSGNNGGGSNGGGSNGGNGTGGGGNPDGAAAVPVYSAFPSKCLDVTAGNTANGTPIDIYDCNNTASQRWTPVATGGGFALKAFGKCLDVTGGNAANGTRVDLYDCNGTAAQAWRQGQDYSLVNPGSGKCLDVPAGNPANGTALQIWDCNASDGQRWGLNSVPPRGPQRPAQQPGTTPAVVPGIGSSQVATLRSANNAMVADLDGANTASGTSIKSLAANGNDAQRWAFWPTANGRWIIETLLTDGKTAAGQGMVMDHDPGNHRAHLIRTADGNANQHWAFHDAGGGWYWITSDTDNGCLTAANPGEQLGIWACDGSDKQRWRLDNIQNGPTQGGGSGGGTGGGNTGGSPGGGSNGGGNAGNGGAPQGGGGSGVRHGVTTVLHSGNNDMVADLDGGNTAAGTRIKANGANGNTAQQWMLWQKPNNQWQIETKFAGAMLMDHNPSTHRTHLTSAQEGNNNQLWRFQEGTPGWYRIVSVADNGCLTAVNNNEDLAVWACAASSAQWWKLDEATGGGNGGGGNTGGGGGGGNTGGGGGGGGGVRLPPGIQLPPTCNGRQSSAAWMWHGDTLCQGQRLTSSAAEQSTRLEMQRDGNLVAYYTEGDALGDHTWPVWETKTMGCGFRAVMQDDGNLVVYSADDRVCWSSGTPGRDGAWLMVSPLGNIQVLQAGDANGAAIDAAHALAAAGKGQFLEAFIDALQAIIKAIPRVQWETHTGHQRLLPPKCVVSGGRVIPCT